MNGNSLGTLTPFAARVYGVAVIIAALLLLASTVAFITVGDGINEGVLGGVLGIWGAFALAIGLMGILRLMEPRAPRAAPILTVFALISAAAGVGIQLDYLMQHEMGPELSAAVDEALVGADGPLAIAILPGLLLPPTLVAIGIFLWRTRTTPWWSGALLIAGGVMFIIAMPDGIAPLAVLTDVLLLLALVPIGWSMIRAARRDAPPPAPSGADQIAAQSD